MNRLFSLLLLCGFAMVACSKEDTKVKNQNAIEDYLAENNLTADFIDESGVYIIITSEGSSSAHPSATDDVQVTYKGYDLDGNVFDQNTAGITFNLSNLILGWRIGIPYLTKGGSGILLIPSHLAYGSQNPSNNEPIVFEIGLLDF